MIPRSDRWLVTARALLDLPTELTLQWGETRYSAYERRNVPAWTPLVSLSTNCERSLPATFEFVEQPPPRDLDERRDGWTGWGPPIREGHTLTGDGRELAIGSTVAEYLTTVAASDRPGLVEVRACPCFYCETDLEGRSEPLREAFTRISLSYDQIPGRRPHTRPLTEPAPSAVHVWNLPAPYVARRIFDLARLVDTTFWGWLPTTSSFWYRTGSKVTPDPVRIAKPVRDEALAAALTQWVNREVYQVLLPLLEHLGHDPRGTERADEGTAVPIAVCEQAHQNLAERVLGRRVRMPDHIGPDTSWVFVPAEPVGATVKIGPTSTTSALWAPEAFTTWREDDYAGAATAALLAAPVGVDVTDGVVAVLVPDELLEVFSGALHTPAQEDDDAATLATMWRVATGHGDTDAVRARSLISALRLADL